MNFNIFSRYYTELNKKEIKDAILIPFQSYTNFKFLYGLCFFYSSFIYVIVFTVFLIINPVLILYAIIIPLFILLIFRIFIYFKRQINDFKLYYDQYLKPILDAFKNYLGGKRKRRDNLTIKNIIYRIERAAVHFKKFKIFFNLNYFFFGISIYIFFFGFFKLELELIMLQNWSVIILFINYYFLIIFIIRNYHFKNLKRSKFLFKRIYVEKLNEIYSELETITFYKTINTHKREIYNKLKVWHRLLYGRYPLENEKEEELIYENRLSQVDTNELEKFYDLFNSLKMNLLNEKLTIELRSDLNEMNNLDASLANYIEMLNFKISENDKINQRKEQKRTFIYSTISLAVSACSFIIVFLKTFS